MKRHSRAAAAALIGVAGFTAAGTSIADPLDANLRVPETGHVSPYAGYVPYRDEKLRPWREVNDEVERAGGHIGILKEEKAAQAAKPAPEVKLGEPPRASAPAREANPGRPAEPPSAPTRGHQHKH